MSPKRVEITCINAWGRRPLTSSSKGDVIREPSHGTGAAEPPSVETTRGENAGHVLALGSPFPTTLVSTTMDIGDDCRSRQAQGAACGHHDTARRRYGHDTDRSQGAGAAVANWAGRSRASVASTPRAGAWWPDCRDLAGRMGKDDAVESMGPAHRLHVRGRVGVLGRVRRRARPVLDVCVDSSAEGGASCRRWRAAGARGSRGRSGGSRVADVAQLACGHHPAPCSGSRRLPRAQRRPAAQPGRVLVDLRASVVAVS